MVPMQRIFTRLQLSAAALACVLPTVALAQDDPAKGIVDAAGGADCDFGSGKIGPECLNVIIANAIEVVFAFAGAICLLNIIVAGYQIAIGNVSGEGDTGGKTRLRNALIGFFVTAATFGIINAALDAVTP